MPHFDQPVQTLPAPRPESAASSLPTFVGIGAQRAATTWAYSCLKEHPEVFVSEEKEIHFFDTHFDRGLDWYKAHFRGAAGKKAAGEITPNYLDVPQAVPRLAEVLPDARLFVILRDPVERTFSQYHLLHEKFSGMSFRQACEHARGIVETSLYADQLERVYAHYRRDQVKVLLYDDVQSRPDQVLAELFGFLGVDATFRPDSTGKVFNHILLPRSQKLLNTVGMGWFISLLKKSPVGEWLKKQASRRSRSKDKTAGDEYFSHLKAFFREDVLRVQAIIGRDLSAWL
jgi:hypothetical protein